MSQENKPQKKFDPKLLRRIIALAKPYPKAFALAAFLAVGLAPLATLRPYLIQQMVDKHIFRYDLEGMNRLVFILFGLLIIEAALQFVFNYITSWLGAAVVRDLRNAVFQQISNMKMRYFDTTPIGQSTTRTINDIEAINSVFSEGLMTIIADVLTLVFVLALMLYTSWQLTLVCMIVLPLLLLASYWFKEEVRKSFQAVRTSYGNMNAFLQERISGMRIVQIFNAEKQEMDRFGVINKTYTDANLKSIFAYSVFFPIVDIMSAAALGLMVWYGAGRVVQNQLTLGVLVSFPVYLNMLFRPIRMLADKFNTLQMGMVAAARVFELTDNTDDVEKGGTIVPVRLKGEIAFEGVNFAYTAEDWVLKNVSFNLAPKQTMAVVGSTGSGKTTIVSLLSRFYTPQSGIIKIDGLPIQDYNLEGLRRRIAVVLQDVNLFGGTVLENITLHDPNITREQAIAAAQLIGAHAFIMALPNNYDYQVQERGATLSMGQRQLISFVRALVFDPDILILDEATSSIDPETEGVIQYAIEKMIAQRTAIIIAHRLSTVRNADTILVVKKGQIVEQGTHKELLDLPSGQYRHLYEMRFAEQQPA